MQFMLLFSRQGKLRLQKWYVPLSDKEKKKITRELVQTVLARKPKMCSFLEWRDLKIVYKRYASLYFCCAIEDQDNELITLEIIHRYVELLDKYFGSVCELDIIFNFEKAYFILDEFLLGGEAQETSKKNVLKAIEQADLLQEIFERASFQHLLWDSIITHHDIHVTFLRIPKKQRLLAASWRKSDSHKNALLLCSSLAS
ncbi:AP-1 complex subunit sigma-2 isoform X2 [Oryzias melastigma]|uniref:AP-1 complex subunit sigma-2 isoform X2 n=1 Tax=Oryzias melastigma TaxID=30732 RepID=UPI00168CE712|nr:AP-1 complex subunit sigma-2 isoform X2 [Oryzias melastigma]